MVPEGNPAKVLGRATAAEWLYNKEAAELAWGRTLVFLKKQLAA